MEAYKTYVDWLFEVADKNLNAKLRDCPLIFSEWHTAETLNKVLARWDITVSEESAKKVADMWSKADIEVFAYCCGSPIVNLLQEPAKKLTVKSAYELGIFNTLDGEAREVTPDAKKIEMKDVNK